MSGINNEYNEQEIAGSVTAGTSMFSDLFRRFGQPPMVVPEADEQCRTYYQEILHIKARLEEIDASNRGIDRIVVNADGTLTVYYSDGTTYTSPSLKGADGQDGKDGQDGQDGQDGAPGRDGVDGQDGAPGQDGQDGVTPNITVTATVDNTPGTAGVTVTKSGTDANPIFAFNFVHVKGDQGTQGIPGQDGVSPTAYVTQTGTNEVTFTVIDGNGTTTATLTGEAGAPGRDGQDGQDGEDGVSPVITVTDITGGHRVTISDADGTQSFDVMDGTDGTDGQPGQNGVSPVVTVTDITGGHQVSITDASSTQTFNVMNGSNGTDGVSPTIAVTAITGGHQVAITDAQGTDTFNVMDGTDGQDGSDGQDGVSPTIDVVTITGGHRVDITDAQGSESFNVMDGSDGAPGQNGQDGVTPDITMTATADALVSANPTVSVTKGGTAANPTFALAFSGLKGAQGNPGQDAEWPSGGSVGDILTKTASGVAWSTPSGGGGMELIGTYNYGTNMKTIFADIYSHANNDDIVMFVRNDQYGNTPLRCSLPRYSQGTSGNENSCLRYTMTASGISLGSYIPSYMILGNKKFLCKKYPDSRYPKLTLTDASMLGKMAEDELNPAYIAYLTLQHKMSYVSAGGICQSWSSNGGGYMFVNINRELETSLDAATLTIDYSCKVYVLRAGS
jgi:hypothetical protein